MDFLKSSKFWSARKYMSNAYYLIKWEGYGPEERTWIPNKYVLALPRIKKFHLKYPFKYSNN